MSATNTAADGQPAYSPDGKRIAYYHTPEGQQAGTYYVMDPDGGNREALVKGESPIEGGRPTWKPK